MILRPVRPVSPCGPPMTNWPVGLMRYSVSLVSSFFGRTFLMTFSMQNFSMVAWSTSCSVLGGDDDVHDSRVGLPLTYSTATWVLASGRSHLACRPALRISVSLLTEAVGEHDGRRHELGSLIACISEHDPLVSGTLLFGLLAFCLGLASTPWAMSGGLGR